MENIEKADAIEIDQLEEVAGGDARGRLPVYNFECQRCGRTVPLLKPTTGLDCPYCGGKLVFVGVMS